MNEDFISEPITPQPPFSTSLMAAGLASLPAAFEWRGRRYEISECLEHYKESAPEGGAPGGERYLRRQVFKVLLNTGQRATIYIERGRRRWFLYSIERPFCPPRDGGIP